MATCSPPICATARRHLELYDPATGRRLFRPSRLTVEQAVQGDSGDPGRLVLTVSLAGVYQQTGWLLLAVTMAALLALWASKVLLQRLNVRVLGPLGELGESHAAGV